jgi:hypothetical protein
MVDIHGLRRRFGLAFARVSGAGNYPIHGKAAFEISIVEAIGHCAVATIGEV